LEPLNRSLLHLLLTVFLTLGFVPNVYAQKRIGVIMTGDIPYYAVMHKAFVDEINKRFAEEEKIEFILQRPFPNSISWSNAARKLIAFDVDLIVTYGSPAALAVIHEKTNIPLVYAGFYEPEELQASSARNVTGCGFRVPLSSILRYFKRVKNINTLGVVFSSIEEDSMRQFETMKHLTEHQGIKIAKIDIQAQSDLDKLKTKRPDVVFITGSSLAHLWLNDLVTILEKQQIPVADIFPDENEAGVLMTLFQPSQTQGEMAAEMAWQILQGTKPADIAPYTLRDTELVFNLVEARRLGIDFPIQLLIEATRVIE